MVFGELGYAGAIDFLFQRKTDKVLPIYSTLTLWEIAGGDKDNPYFHPLKRLQYEMQMCDFDLKIFCFY